MNKKYSDKEIIEHIQGTEQMKKEMTAYLYLNQGLKNQAFSMFPSIQKEEQGQVVENIYTDTLLIFIRNVRKDSFNKKSKLSSYFLGTYKKKCFQYFQKKKSISKNTENVVTEFLRRMELNEKDPFNYFPEEKPHYETLLKRKIYVQLSAGCQKTLKQKYEDGLSVKEIAKIDQKGEQSVKNALSWCRKRLRKLIEQDAEVLAQIKKHYAKAFQ